MLRGVLDMLLQLNSTLDGSGAEAGLQLCILKGEHFYNNTLFWVPYILLESFLWLSE